jgi:hypothetical protein
MESTQGDKAVKNGLRSRVVLAFLLAVLLLALPSMSAQSATFETIEVRLAPEVFEADLLGERYEGQRAIDLRREIDHYHGDDDGEVTPEEVDAWRQATMDELNDQFRFLGVFSSDIQVNGRGPMQIRVIDIHVTENVVGPVDDDTTVIRDVEAEMVFIQNQRDRANITFAQDFREVFLGRLYWDNAVFTGAAPWSIDTETIHPDEAYERFWEQDRFVVPYDETDTFASGFDPLTFQILDTTAIDETEDEEEESPMIGTFLLLGLAGLAVAMTRRTR